MCFVAAILAFITYCVYDKPFYHITWQECSVTISQTMAGGLLSQARNPNPEDYACLALFLEKQAYTESMRCCCLRRIQRESVFLSEKFYWFMIATYQEILS